MSTTYPEYPHSNFPDGLDSWETFLDVVDSDAELLKQYQQYVLDGDMINAQIVYEQIPNANRKFIGALVMNQFADAIMSLEKFYGNSGFENYIIQKQNEWQTIIDEFSYVGVYDDRKQYYKNNIVLYNIDGQNYLFLNIFDGATIGKNPISSDFWRILTIQGKKGEAGSSTTFYFEWDSVMQYRTNNVVCVGSSLYVALMDNVNLKPDDNPDYWQIIFDLPRVYYPLQATQPVGQEVGDLWFRIVA